MNQRPVAIMGEFPLPDGSVLQPLRTGHVRIDRPATLQGRTAAAAILAAAACQRGWEVVCAPAPHPATVSSAPVPGPLGAFFEAVPEAVPMVPADMTIEPGPHAGLVAYVHAELQRRPHRTAAAAEPLLLVLDDTVATAPGRQAAAPVLRQLIDIVRVGRRSRVIVALEVVDTDPPWSAPPYLPAQLLSQLTTRLTVDGIPRPDTDPRWQPSRSAAPRPARRPVLAALRGIRGRWHRRWRQGRRQEGSVQ